MDSRADRESTDARSGEGVAAEQVEEVVEVEK
jgi:hypothetical protein